MARVAVLAVALVSVLAARPLPAPAQDATPAAATPPPPGVVRERLIEETRGQTDQFGRVPLARLTFAPGAALPAGFLVGPLLAVVEAGAFDVRIGSAPATVGSGERFDVADQSPVAARNTADSAGSWLVLALRRDTAWFEAGAWGPATEFPAPGVDFRLLFTHHELKDRIFPVRFTVDRLTLTSGAAIASVDLGGPTPTRYVRLLVETGSVVAGPAATGPDGEAMLRAGDVLHVDPAATGGVRAIGREPAVLLLVRVAEDAAA